MTRCRLSICIATRNRCGLLLETLDSVRHQVDDTVEIIVVDGASTDGTPQALARLAPAFPQLRYFREKSNGGIDRDYDKAVTYASGDYCWLMSDDDLFLPGSVSRVLGAADSQPSLIVVDAQVRDASQCEVLLERRLEIAHDRIYAAGQMEELFLATARQLSFIGSCVVKRALWIERDRDAYFGSFFVHIGVVFQAALPQGAVVLRRPCLSIRYGNASWTSRSFEIWMLHWPGIVWSLPTITDAAKGLVVAKAPHESVRELVLLRSKGSYSWTEYVRWISPSQSAKGRKLIAAGIAIVPGVILNLLAVAYVLAFSRARKFALVDLMDSRYFPFRFMRHSHPDRKG